MRGRISETGITNSRKRNAANIGTFLGTCVLLFALVGISSGELASGIKKMTIDLNKALMEVLSDLENIQYDDYKPREDYNSSTVFNSKGMAVLYNITDIFIKSLMPEPLPTELILISDRRVGIKENDYLGLARHYLLYLVFITSLLIFALLMPLCGFCFCCCRCCCGKCGARVKPFDKKGDLCKKILHASLLIILGTLFLFGVVCAFVTNQQMQEGTDELVKNLKTSVDDASAYLEDTSSHAEHLLKNNFGLFSNKLKQTLGDSSDILYGELANMTKATYIDDALELAQKVEPLKNDLSTLKNLTNTLRVQASQLNDATRKIKRDLLETLNNCLQVVQQCGELMNNYVAKLGTNIDFNKYLDRYFPRIPDVSTALDKMELLDTEIVTSIEKGKHELDNLKYTINKEVKTNIEKAQNAIDDAGAKINSESEKLLKFIKEMNDKMTKQSNGGLDIANKYINDYSKYRYYVGLGVSCALLLISLCIALGLVCGICGKRPDSYNDDCCNKGAGSRFLIFGVGIMFLTASVLVLVLLIHNLGMFVHLIVCDPIRHPNESKILKFLDSTGKLEEIMWPGVSFTSIIDNCYKNESAYKVFKLEKKFDVNQIRKYVHEFNIDKTMDDFKENLEEIKFDKINLNVDESVKQLESLKKSGLSSIDFEKFKDEVSVSFTTVDLSVFRNELEKLINSLKEKGKFEDMINKLELITIHIDAYIEKLFNPMKKNAENVINTSSNIMNTINSGGNGFETMINNLIMNLKDAENALKNTGPKVLINITEDFSREIVKQINYFVEYTVKNVENKVGNCGPFALIINGTMTSTCDKILTPMNGFWFSVLWCLILFVPTIIISVKLASLYKKSDAFPGSFAESEYLYDAYANRENIPLARGKNGKKKKKHRGGEMYAESFDPNARDYPAGSHHPDARYADMAPKHFEDYPNGGPPQYQRATEYERPPPYYYPGSGDQN